MITKTKCFIIIIMEEIVYIEIKIPRFVTLNRSSIYLNDILLDFSFKSQPGIIFRKISEIWKSFGRFKIFLENSANSQFR